MLVLMKISPMTRAPRVLQGYLARKNAHPLGSWVGHRPTVESWGALFSYKRGAPIVLVSMKVAAVNRVSRVLQGYLAHKKHLVPRDLQ